MKLLYTDIRTSLTEILTREAEELVAAGKRVFYIAPNSLSFEKERAVLECLSQQASFAITVTRFAQMARYLVLNDLPVKNSLDDIGLGMAFYKCLAELDPKDLRVYGAIKQDPQFIQQLVELYHEMTTAQMSFLDLESLTDEVVVSAISLSESLITAAISALVWRPHIIMWKPVRQPNGEQSIMPSMRVRMSLAKRCSIV